jgi:transcription termination factor Rho
MTTTIQQSNAQARAVEASASVPVSGLVDPADGHALIRVSGYRPSPADVYVSAGQIRQYGLRKGDQIDGTARPSPGGRAKFRPLVSVDTVNGMPPELARVRPHFDELTPLYPEQRLRLEDGNPSDTARIIDLVAPIGKGQRGLIVSPPKAGKTMILQAIAASIAAAHPEIQLMVVLVGERPEEVTDLRRSVRGEVVFSNWPSSGPSAWLRRAATWWCCSTH